MVYTIEQERLMKVMSKFLKDILPDLELPLNKRTILDRGNSAYGSKTYYVDKNDRDVPWFIEYDEKDIDENNKWDVSDRFKPLYEYFGQDNFELFIKWLFGFNITYSGKFKYNWLFTDMIYFIIESNPPRSLNEYVMDEISDENLFKIINKLVRHIYGKDLTMVENEHGYLRFFSVGPVPPYHRNLSGRLWVDDDRLEKMIENLFGIDSEQATALIAFYFSEKYNIKITDARPPLSMGWYERVIDYNMFDNPDYVVPNED